MPHWEPNKYFSFKSTNEECIQIATDLLNSYSLTRGCLEILGQELKDQLEFGFFKKGADIIVQGESGRDIYMLCSGAIDVLVADQVVVQMKALTLVGDKGIVSANAERAATIRISSEDPSLVIKIPMGSFIRNFKDTSINDESFVQEKKIFENIFQIVQERLFDFIYLQKTLWEQASNTIHLLNQQIYAKQLDNKIEPNWNHEAWSIAQKYLESKFSISWPQGKPFNSENLNGYLRKFIELKYKDVKSQDALIAKKLEWRNTLTEISGRVLNSIPDGKKAVPPLDLDLFNPNIYRMRLVGLQNQLQKRYESRKVKKRADKDFDSASFFGKGERSNEFNLSFYLEYFFKMYQIKNPRRLLAQVGQKCALIAAECENNFNSSVVKMQKFLDEVKSRNINLEGAKKKSQVDQNKVKSWISTLIRGMHHYRDSSPSIEKQTLGIIKFSENFFPNFSQMIKAHRVQFTRDKMNQSFANLIKVTQFQSEYLSKHMLSSVFHVCGIERGDTIPESELQKGYWFPLTDHLKLSYKKREMFHAGACSPIGGVHWNSNLEQEGQDSENALCIDTVEDTIIMILPVNRLPWVILPNPDTTAFTEIFMPLMQWLIDKNIEFLVHLQSKRDEIVDEWTEIKDGIVRSEKIAIFEKKALKLPKNDYNRIISWLNSTLGMKLDPGEILPSNKLSKRIYNFFLHTATVDNPEMTIEQRGNQAYTRWRNLLFELTDQIPALNKVVSKLPGTEPQPVLDILAKQLTPFVAQHIKDTWEKQNPITSGNPNLNLLPIIHPDKHESPEDCIRLYKEIQDIFAKITFKLVMEIDRQKDTLSSLLEKRSQSDITTNVKSDHVDMRQESVKNLTKLLSEISS